MPSRILKMLAKSMWRSPLHTIEKTEGSNDFCFKARGDNRRRSCFVLDQPKESKKKKAHWNQSFPLCWTKLETRQRMTKIKIISLEDPLQANSSATTFGSKIVLTKLRTCQNLKICWRLRHWWQTNTTLSKTTFTLIVIVYPHWCDREL